MWFYWCPKKTPFSSFSPQGAITGQKTMSMGASHDQLLFKTLLVTQLDNEALHPIHSLLDYWAEGFPLSRQKAKTHENRPQHQLTESRFVTTSPQEYCIYSIECVCVCFWVNNKINRVCLTLFSTNLHLLASGVQNHKWVFFCPTLYLLIRRQKTKKV